MFADAPWRICAGWQRSGCGLLVGNRLGLRVGLVIDEALLGFEHLAACEGGIAPAFDFDALAFEVFIDGEKVGDLLEHVGIDLGEVPDVLVARVALADAEDFLVAEALIEHFEESDGTDFHNASGEAGGVDEDQAVEGIAVVAEGAGDEAVVAGVVDWRVEVAIEAEDVQFFVVLVFIDSFVRNLDDGIDDFRGVFSDRELQIIRHKGWHLVSLVKGYVSVDQISWLLEQRGRLKCFGPMSSSTSFHVDYNQTR